MYLDGNRSRLIAAWEAQALRRGGHDVLVATCRAGYFSGKGERP
jgi:hypothetical protein